MSLTVVYVHPPWCDGELCTAHLAGGEHRSKVQAVDTSTLEPALPVTLQLVQEEAVGGATPALVVAYGAERVAIPVGTAQAIVDQVVPMLWSTDDQVERVEVGDVPEPREAGA